MKKILAALAIAGGLALMPTMASAQDRLTDGVLGAAAGAVVGGPVGAVAGGAIGYTAGPRIGRRLGYHRPYGYHRSYGYGRPAYGYHRYRRHHHY